MKSWTEETLFLFLTLIKIFIKILRRTDYPNFVRLVSPADCENAADVQITEPFRAQTSRLRQETFQLLVLKLYLKQHFPQRNSEFA